MLILNPDLEMAYLVIGKGFPSDLILQRNRPKLLEEEDIDLILDPPAVPLPQPTDREFPRSKPPDLLGRHQWKRREVMTGKSNPLLTRL